jgi:peptide deformylase
MAIREILTVPHDALKRKALKVTDFGPGLQTLIDDMIETMHAAPGSGLAGNQIGELQRVFIAEFGDEEDEEVPPKLYIFVNPEITRKSTETINGIEGCLSVPDFVGEVARATAVTIKGQNRHGQKMKLKASGWLARIFQHEVDHLNGVVFLDRAEKVYSLEDIQSEEMSGEIPAGTPTEIG